MIRDVIWQTGPSQSNGWGVNPGGSGADLATVPYWDTLIGTSASVALHSLTGAASGGHGKDYTVGSLLYAAGYRPIYVNISRGSSMSNQWIPPAGAYYATMISEVTAAWAAIRAAYPNDTFRHHHVSDQGEAEARYGYPVPDAAKTAVIMAWADNYALCHAALEATIGARMQRWVIQTNSLIDFKVLPGVLEGLQLSAADNATHLINRNPDRGVTYEPDGVHMDTAGYIKTGEIFVSQFRQANPMGSLSTFAKTTLVNHVRNKATYSPAATHYLHLYADAACTVPLTGGTAPSYAAVSQTNNTTTWPAPSSRTVASGVAWNFPTPTGTWPNVAGWKLTDSATEGAGNVLAQHALVASVAVNTGTGPIGFAIGAITVVAATNVATGGFVDAVVHGLLGLMFGGTAFAPLATTFGAWWAGDPAGAGAQAGSRVSLTQATTWGSASGGMAVTAASISLTQQATGTYWAEFDASVAGNLLYSAPRPASVGSTGTILAGQIQTVIT